MMSICCILDYMWREWTIVVIGVISALLEYLGFPSGVRRIAIALLALLSSALAFWLISEKKGDNVEDFTSNSDETIKK